MKLVVERASQRVVGAHDRPRGDPEHRHRGEARRHQGGVRRDHRHPPTAAEEFVTMREKAS